MTSDQQLLTAIHQFIDGRANVQEKKIVYAWYNGDEFNRPIFYALNSVDKPLRPGLQPGVRIADGGISAQRPLTERYLVEDTLTGNGQQTYLQLLPAVAKLITAEAMEASQKQTRLLLNFSSTIATARDHGELLNAINDIPRELLHFSHTVVCTVDEQQNVKAFLCDPSTASKNHPDYQLAKHYRFSVYDGILDKVAEASAPLIFDLEELSRSAEFPLYFKINFESGIKQAVITRFPKGDDVFGFWMLFFKEKQQFGAESIKLIEGLASQLCVAVSNISANKRIKEQLLQIDRYKQQLEDDYIYLKEDEIGATSYPEIIGESRALKQVFNLIDKVSPSSSTVLILGETGTGKELVAHAIHNASPRKNKPLIKVNCAALPASLIESELFGHERGSFTGATERRLGKFELANGGTLFLDEVGEMSLDIQVKLLRALQEREIERIGGKGTIRVDVRIIAATNRDLEKEMDEGRFRRDLYYRLNIFPIVMPALRERIEDIPLLVSFFIKRFAKKSGKKIDQISTRALDTLVRYDWPGNIRELEHAIERGMLLTADRCLKQVSLPDHKPAIAEESVDESVTIKTIDENERDHIYKVLKFCKGRVGGELGAAEILGVPASTLFSKMKKLGIRKGFN